MEDKASAAENVMTADEENELSTNIKDNLKFEEQVPANYGGTDNLKARAMIEENEKEISNENLHDSPTLPNPYDENGVVNNTLNILDLPPEIILRIFVHVDIRTVFKNLIVTCKTFHQILTTEGIWKSIFSIKWENTKITKDYDYVGDWKEVYLAYSDIHSYWKRKDKFRLECKRMIGHYGSIDAVHVMPGGRYAVSGSRDRSAIVWDMQEFEHGNEGNENIVQTATLTGHTGWVWAVACDANRSHEVITGSWDNKIKIWDLERNGENTQTYKYHRTAILDAVVHDGLIYTGSYGKKIRIFDPRSQDTQILTHHKGPVLNIIVDDNMIISNSEDKTIGVFDRRMTSNKPKAVLSVPCGGRVTCMNLAHEQGFNYLRAGVANGTFSIFDTTNQVFTHLESFKWDTTKVLKFTNFYGAFMACAPGGVLKVYSPDRQRLLLDSFQKHDHDISSVHNRNGIMVTGSCDDTVGFWKFCQI